MQTETSIKESRGQTMRIDSHVHFWRLNRGDYLYPPKENTLLYRDYLPQELVPILSHHSINAVLAVQATPTLAETRYLLELAEQESSICGVIGWMDCLSSSCQDPLDEFSSSPWFAGIRIPFHQIHQENGSLSLFYENLSLLSKRRCPVDFLLSYKQLPSLLDVLKRVPELITVINHLAFPSMEEGALQLWQSSLKEIATYPNTVCKLSGMISNQSGGSPADWKLWNPLISFLYETFGARRLMFGSDWPVGLQGGTYEEILTLLDKSLPSGLQESELADIYGHTALRWYHRYLLL